MDVAVAAIDRLAQRELIDTGVPGLAVALTGRQGPVEVRTYGLADMGARRTVEPDTLFEVGSIGKTFTALVILRLVEEGRVALNAPVADALPWFDVPIVGRAITIHDLLSHTAGITAGIDGTPEAAFQVWALRDRRPGSAPGERFHYSNVGYKALGLVIEAIEGRPYPRVIKDRILDPLGMTTTEPAITSDIRPRLAVGYDYLHDDRIGYPGQPLVPATWIETGTADGSIASTAGDMAAFGRMLLRRGEGPNGRLVTEASFAKMAAWHARPSADSAYGYGLATRMIGGRTFLGHGGGMLGYVAAVQVDEAAGSAVVVLENGLMGRPMELARAALRASGPSSDDGEPASTTQASGSRVLAGPELAGIYRPDRDGPGSRDEDLLEVVGEGDGPTLRWRGESLALESLGDGRFLAAHPDLDRFAIRFEPADRHPAVAWHGPQRFVRDGATPPPLQRPDDHVAAVAGHYRSHDPWTTNFRVIIRGDVPWLVFAGAPDGFEDEQRLSQRPDGSFLVGDDSRGPEDLRFDTVVGGRPLRGWLSGYAYYRVGDGG